MNKVHAVNPTISVLLSCYNGSRWLNEAIGSVLCQTFSDFEFIIVDDGSTDGSPEIIKRYAEQDFRIVVISKCNSGLTDSLNVGIRQARGKWIARIDADDICEPERLELQISMAMQNPSLVFIGSGLLAIDERGKVLKTYRYPNCHALLVSELYNSGKFPPHSSAFYRSDVVRSIGGYRSRIIKAQDRDLWLRLSDVGQLGAINNPLVRVRKHSEQISSGESGRLQKVYSHVAIISYFLRHYGYSDPVGANDEVFETFYAWVASRLEQERFFEYFKYKECIKKNINLIHKSPFALLAVLRNIFSNPSFLMRFLKSRLFGDTGPKRLAREWMRKNNTCAAS